MLIPRRNWKKFNARAEKNAYLYLLVFEIGTVVVVLVIGVLTLRSQHGYIAFAIIGSAATGLLAAAWEYFIKRLQHRHLEHSKREIQQLQLSVAGEIGKRSEQDVALVPLVVSTSPAQTSSARYLYEIAELRAQLAEVVDRLDEKKSEIVEVQKVDPVLEATLKASIENLTKRIEALEKTRLERWDVTLVLLQLLGAIGVALGMVLAVAKYFAGN